MPEAARKRRDCGAAVRLHGHSIPLGSGGYVVTVVCPNEGSHERLRAEIARIEADAFAPTIAVEDGYPATGGGYVTHYVEPQEGQPLSAQQAALAEFIDSKEVSGPADIGLNVETAKGNPPAVDTGD